MECSDSRTCEHGKSYDDDCADCDATWNTCGTCSNRLNEECGLDGHNVYDDTTACDDFAEQDT